MVNVLVLGATGPTGQALVKEALKRNHTVVIFARSPQKLPEEISSNPSVKIVKGTLEDEDSIRHAFEALNEPSEHAGDGQSSAKTSKINAVVSAIGPPVQKIHPSGHPIAKGYETVVRIGKEYGVTRFIVLGTASITDENDKFDVRFKTLVFGVQYFAPHAYEDVTEIGKVFANLEDVDWTIARVPVLYSPKDGHYATGYIGDGHTNTWLTRPMFANFVFDEIAQARFIRKRPMISMTNAQPGSTI